MACLIVDGMFLHTYITTEDTTSEVRILVKILIRSTTGQRTGSLSSAPTKPSPYFSRIYETKPFHKETASLCAETSPQLLVDRQ